TAINLAQPLHEAGIRLLGSSFESIDLAEDRDKFEQLLRDLGIPKPAGRAVRSTEAALEVAEEIGFPVLVRPRYVLGGRAVEVVPPQALPPAAMEKMVDYAIRVARALKVVGLMNIQFVVEGEEVYILEVNPRSSRTVPYLSKITAVPMVQVATRCMLGEKLR